MEEYILSVAYELCQWLESDEVESYASAFQTFVPETDINRTHSFSSRQIVDWFQTEMEQWVCERAPFLLYVKFLALSFCDIPLPRPLFVPALKVLNYYGNYELVIRLCDSHEYSQNDFEVKKHLAKAYKSLGLFPKAMEIYREALLYAKKSGDEVQRAFYLTLFAKLYDDYQQKNGMHTFYHSMAAEIAQECINVSTTEKLTHKQHRSLEICIDSYAKAIYPIDPNKGEILFRSVINSHREYDDAKIRMQANYCLVRFEALIIKFERDDFVSITKLIDELNIIINKTIYDFGNEIAYSVRTCQLIMLIRKLIERLREKKYIDLEEIIFEKMPYEDIVSRLENCIQISRRYNDKKYLCYANIEMEKWLLIDNGSRNNNPFGYYRKCIHILLDVLMVLKSKTDDPINIIFSNIYIDVMHELQRLYALNGDYDESAKCCQKLYDFFQILLDDLDCDVKIINEMLATKPHFPEHFDLTPEQGRDLQSSLLRDYQELVKKMLSISRLINSLQYNAFSEYVMNVDALGKEIDLHTLRNDINLIISDTNEKAVIRGLRQLDKALTHLGETTKQMRMPTQEINLILEVRDFIGGIEFERIRDHIQVMEQEEPMMALFNRHLLYKIVKNLVSNVVNVADVNHVDNYRMSIGFDLLANGRSIAIVVRDNVGSFDKLLSAVNHINSEENVKHDNSSRMRHGNGLRHVKVMTNQRGLWTVRMIEQDEMTKELVIPLCERSGFVKEIRQW